MTDLNDRAAADVLAAVTRASPSLAETDYDHFDGLFETELALLGDLSDICETADELELNVIPVPVPALRSLVDRLKLYCAAARALNSMTADAAADQGDRSE